MEKEHVHLMGIAGCAISGVALLANAHGYKVTGCDTSPNSDLPSHLRKANIPIFKTHSSTHLEEADIVLASSYLLNNQKRPDELQQAIKDKKLMKWQDFLGKRIFPHYENVVAVTGTHGKTTTSAILAHSLNFLGLKPTAHIGAVVNDWSSNILLGNNKMMICEADEYDRNSISYEPNVVLLTNIEMEYPDRYASYAEYEKNFHALLLTVKKNGKIFFNADCENSLNLIKKNRSSLKEKGITLIAYTSQARENDGRLRETADRVYNYAHTLTPQHFVIDSEVYISPLRGLHNVQNSACTAIVALEMGLKPADISSSLKNFHGIDHRLEQIFHSGTVSLYDDYSHHHTHVKNSLETLRKEGDAGKLIAVFEPHQISRIAANTQEYLSALNIADHVIITKPFKSREEKAETDVISPLLDGKKIHYIENFDLIARTVCFMARACPADIVIMGAGSSRKLAQKVKHELERQDNLNSPAKEIYVFRHGESFWNLENRCQGQLDDLSNLLTDNGIEQVRRMLPLLRSKNIELIVSSDLKRAKQTSQILSDGLNIPVIYDERLREVSFGDAEGLTVDEIRSAYPDFNKSKSNHDIPFPGGESIRAARERMEELMLDVITTFKQNKIAICSHAMITGSFLGKVSNSFFIKMPNAQISHLSCVGGNLYLVTEPKGNSALRGSNER